MDQSSTSPYDLSVSSPRFGNNGTSISVDLNNYGYFKLSGKSFYDDDFGSLNMYAYVSDLKHLSKVCFSTFFPLSTFSPLYLLSLFRLPPLVPSPFLRSSLRTNIFAVVGCRCSHSRELERVLQSPLPNQLHRGTCGDQFLGADKYQIKTNRRRRGD